VHVKGKSIGLADCLSRFPCEEENTHTQLDDDLMVCPVDAFFGKQHIEIVQATNDDPELQELKSVILKGWPEVRQSLPVSV
jgi:hypothetical protein